MMALSKKPYKGCRDLFPKEKREQKFLFDAMHSVAKSFGHEPYDGPMLEEVELYRAKSGQELINDQIYSFIDRGKREVAIRPEMTPTVARMVSSVHREIPKPIRWYSIPNLMRYERPQKGRLREHWQFNVDIFGPENVYHEIEILQIAIQLFKKFGANNTHFGIQINNRSFVDYFFSSTLSLNEEKSYALYKLVDRYKKLKTDVFDSQLNDIGLSEKNNDLLKRYLALDSIDKFMSFAKEINFPTSSWDYENFFNTLDKLKLSNYINFNASIVRGLDYYTGLVFEVFDKHPENRRALCGGGAYNGLMDIFGEEKLPGVGFGLGDVTLKDFLEIHQLMPDFSAPKHDLYLASEDENLEIETLNLSSSLRALELNICNNTTKAKFKKIIQAAAKSGARAVGIMQQQELETIVKIKKLDNDQIETFTINDIEKMKQFILG
jgi:histidyl-tRNA synthetase